MLFERRFLAHQPLKIKTTVNGAEPRTRSTAAATFLDLCRDSHLKTSFKGEAVQKLKIWRRRLCPASPGMKNPERGDKFRQEASGGDCPPRQRAERKRNELSPALPAANQMESSPTWEASRWLRILRTTGLYRPHLADFHLCFGLLRTANLKGGPFRPNYRGRNCLHSSSRRNSKPPKLNF